MKTYEVLNGFSLNYETTGRTDHYVTVSGTLCGKEFGEIGLHSHRHSVDEAENGIKNLAPTWLDVFRLSN